MLQRTTDDFVARCFYTIIRSWEVNAFEEAFRDFGSYYTAGSVTTYSGGDGVHSDGSIAVSGGILNIVTGDDGIHADEKLVISGGDIRIAESHERLEANQIYLSGGDINITADDGGNAAIKPAGCVVFSSPELGVEETYHLTVDGQTVDVMQDAVSATVGKPPSRGK